MSDLQCSLCSQAFHFPSSPGSQVRCPSCRYMVTAVMAGQPANLVTPKGGQPRLPWLAAAGVFALSLGTAAIYSLVRQKTVFETSGLTPYSFVADTWSILAPATLLALAFGVLTAIFGLLGKRSFAPLAAGAFACFLLPLLGYQIYQQAQENGRSVQASALQLDPTAPPEPEPSSAELMAKATNAIRSILPDRNSDTPSRSEVQEAMKGLVDDTQKFMDSAMKPDGSLNNFDVEFKPKANPANQAEQLRAFIQTFYNDMASQQRDYMAELDKAGLPRLLEADRVAADKDFEESYAILYQARLVVKKHRQKTEDLIQTFPDRVKTLGFSAEIESNMRKSFDKSLLKVRPQFKESWDLEEEVVMNFRKIIHLLQASRSRWAPEDGRFMFQEQGDLDRFNSYMTAVNECAERQNAIRSANMNNVQQKLKDL